MTQAYFISDLHLSSRNDPNVKLLLNFLGELEQKHSRALPPTHLFLVGDIFDLWIGSHRYFIDEFAPVVTAIRSLVQKGVAVHFFEGNHDLYLKIFWENEVGVRVHSDQASFRLAGRVVRVEHGDLINPDDKGYLFLRSLLRSGVVEKLALGLPSSLVHAIGVRASRASRGYTSTAKRLDEDKIRELIRSHAQRVYLEGEFDLIITGHVHVRDDVEIEMPGKTFRSVNLGSWYEQPPRAFLLSEPSCGWIELGSYPG